MIALVASMLALILTTEPPRAARSVHLSYIAEECDVFYTEMTVRKSTPGTYFEACGFAGGYFGIQELVSGKKVAIFSVWDPTKGDEASTVPPDQRVTVIFENPNARVKRFGGEGTGAQCMIDFDWSIDQPNCFLVRAEVQGDRTAYAAYIRPKSSEKWEHLATFATLNKGKRLIGLYSFIEDFRRDTTSANESRRATFTNGWIKLNDKWTQLTKARFTASNATWEAKETINAGAEGETFFLQTGGETRQTTKLGDTIERAPTAAAKPPELPTN